MACIVAPYFEPYRHALIAQNVRKAFIIVPALVVYTGRQHISITPHQVQRVPIM